MTRIVYNDLDASTLENGGLTVATYTVVAADATANLVALTLDVPAINFFNVRFLRAGVDVTGDAIITASGKVLTITEEATTPTYVLTAGDVIYIMAAGVVAE